MNIILGLILAISGGEALWEIGGTGIYKPLMPNQVAYSQDHGWFLLDVADQRILKYDADGVFVSTFAKAGQGPSELNKVQYIGFESGILYAVSIHRITLIKGSNQYVKQIKRTDFRNWLVKIPNGWLAYPHALNTRAHQKLILFDNDLMNQHVLTEWETRVIKKKGSFPYRPDIFCFALGRNKTKVFLRKPDTDLVEVWDLPSRMLTKTVNLGIKLDPDAQFKVVLAEAKKNGTGLSSNSWYPDMRIGPAGSLYFYPIRTKDNAVSFDTLGGGKTPRFTREVLDRILHVSQGHVYISWRDEESEQIGMRQTTLEDVSAMVTANPFMD